MPQPKIDPRIKQAQDDLHGLPVTSEEVDAELGGNASFNDTVHLDLAKVPADKWKNVREEAGKLGGKVEISHDGVATVELPHGRKARLLAAVEPLGGRALSVDEQVARDRENAPPDDAHASAGAGAPRELDGMWDARNGAELTNPDTVRHQRLLAMHWAKDGRMSKLVREAEARGDIAPASWQGRQGAESDCVPHALANASNGAFTLKETVAAGKAAGADYSKDGTSEPQLLQMLQSLQETAARKGYAVDYRLTPIEDFFREQEARAKAGRPREPGLVVLRTGGGPGDPHALHAVALRGQIVVDGQAFVVVTDSHLNRPLLYTAEAFSAAVVSNGVLIVDAAKAGEAGRPGTVAMAGSGEAGGAAGSGGGDRKKPDEAAPAPDGDGGHGEHGSVEERRRAKQLDIYVVDPAGRVTLRPDGVIDLPGKPGYGLVQRNKRTGALQLMQGDGRALKKVEDFIARVEKARR